VEKNNLEGGISSIFAKSDKNKKFLGLNANGLENTSSTRCDTPHSDVLLHYGSQNIDYLDRKNGF